MKKSSLMSLSENLAFEVIRIFKNGLTYLLSYDILTCVDINQNGIMKA